MQILNGRFAPSPTGEIHAGTIFAALQSWLIAKSSGGSITMRIEDLDSQRSKTEYGESILRNYEELGLTWNFGPYYQSDRQSYYNDAFYEICKSAEVYDCYCIFHRRHHCNKIVYHFDNMVQNST